MYRTINRLIEQVQSKVSAGKLLPAREIVLGWQTDRIFDELPTKIAMTYFVLASIWTAVAAGGLGGDWNLWIPMGQLFIATLAILLSRLK